MQDRRVRRRWGATVLGSLAAVALVAGCTGDEGVEVVTDDVDGAAALAEAVEATSRSGRFRSTVHMEMPDFAWGDEELTEDELEEQALADELPVDGSDGFPTSMDYVVEGEFSGDDVRIEFTGGFGSGELRSEAIEVDGRFFASADTMTGMYDAFSSGDEELDALMREQRADLEAALGGKAWVEFAAPDVVEDEGAEGDMAADDQGLDALAFGVGSMESLGDPLAVLEDVADVRETEPVEVDGERLRTFIGELADDDVFGGSWEYHSDEELSAEDAERVERIEDYARSRTQSHVEVLVGPDGFVRRIDLEMSDDFEEDYRHCYFLTENGSLSLTVELFDLGESIEIVAPDPATVIDESALDALGGVVSLGSDGAETSFDSLSSVEMFGREATEQMVVDGAALIALDPATIPSLTDEQLDEVFAQIELAAEALPSFDTRIGSRNRLEMIEAIRMGTTMLGIEPLDLSGYSDQQLADLINSYLDEYGFDFGGGDPAEEYDEFEGCPA